MEDPHQFIMLLVDNLSGRIIDSENLVFADRVLDLKRKNQTNPWEVIRFIINEWAKTNPSEYQSFIITMEDTRREQDNEFATSKDKNSSLRRTLDIPHKVLNLIRATYDAEELPFDRTFFREFGKRFPKFKVADKI